MRDNRQPPALALECRILTRTLIGVEPSAEVLNAYCRAHELALPDLVGGARSPLDRALMRIALGGPLLARAADGYAAVFARTSLLRRKLVLLVAILESRRRTADALDRASPGSRVAWVGRMAIRTAACAIRLVVVAVLILPLRVWYRLVGPPTP